MRVASIPGRDKNGCGSTEPCTHAVETLNMQVFVHSHTKSSWCKCGKVRIDNLRHILQSCLRLGLEDNKCVHNFDAET